MGRCLALTVGARWRTLGIARMNQSDDSPSSWNLPFVEELYAEFARDPASIAPEWRSYFASLKNGEPAVVAALRRHWKPRRRPNRARWPVCWSTRRTRAK